MTRNIGNTEFRGVLPEALCNGDLDDDQKVQKIKTAAGVNGVHVNMVSKNEARFVVPHSDDVVPTQENTARELGLVFG